MTEGCTASESKKIGLRVRLRKTSKSTIMTVKQYLKPISVMSTMTVLSPEQMLVSTSDIVLPTGEQIYDSIMCRIEPELMLANLDKLDLLYQGESAEEHSTRYARYGASFAEYRTQYNAWIQSLRGAVDVYKNAVVKASQAVNKASEDSELAAISSQLLSV
jgi:hypothetical protein